MSESEERHMARPACDQLDLRPAGGGDLGPDRYGLASQSTACFSPDVAKLEVGKVIGAIQRWATEPLESQCDEEYSSDARLRSAEQLAGISSCRVGELTADALGAGVGWGLATKKAGLRLVKGAKGKLSDKVSPSGSQTAAPASLTSALPPILPDEANLFARMFAKDPLPVHGDVMGALTARSGGRIVHEEGALVGVEYRAGETIVRRGPDLKIIEEIEVPPGHIVIDTFWGGVEHWRPITVPVLPVGELTRDAHSRLVKGVLRREQERGRR